MQLLRLGLSILFFAIAGFSSLAQEMPSDAHQHTTPPSNARYEIVQSELAAKWTFRLDRFTGHVSQLVKNGDGGDGENSWEWMPIIGLTALNASQATHPRFQIFASGLAAKFTFLIDTETGKTWQLTTTKSKSSSGEETENHSWEPFSE